MSAETISVLCLGSFLLVAFLVGRDLFLFHRAEKRLKILVKQRLSREEYSYLQEGLCQPHFPHPAVFLSARAKLNELLSDLSDRDQRRISRALNQDSQAGQWDYMRRLFK